MDMQQLRDIADYDEVMVSKSKAQKQLKQATEFVSFIVRRLTNEAQS
jgi:hypothetical protein